MNKNIKIVSSLALAGILATSGLSGLSKVSAVEASGSATRSLGKYATLGGVENVVPYILNQGANVTVGDLRKEFGTISLGNNVTSEDAVVGTGDTFKVGNTTYTVLIYGDVNGDGKVNATDALQARLYSVGEESTIKNSLLVEAANVEEVAQNKVNATDALRMQQYSVGDKLTPRDGKPVNVQPVEGGYTLTVGDNNVINNQNFNGTADATNTDNLKLVVDVENSKISDTAKTLDIKVYDADGVLVKETTGIGSISANSNKAVITGKDLNTHLGIATNGTKNGTYTVELIDATNTKKVILARTNINVQIHTPAAAKVNVTRSNATTAALSLVGYGEGKIVKVMYSINGSADKTIENVNNQLSNKTLDFVLPDESVTGNSSTVDITLVDEFGNKNTLSDVKVPEYGSTAETAVTKVTAPVLRGATPVTTAEFVAESENPITATTEAILYDGNGNIVAVGSLSSMKVDFKTSMAKAGKYRVGVTVKGNGTTKTDSTEVFSDYVEVKELNAVTNVKFAVAENGDKVLTFTDSNNKNNINTTTPNSSEYTITFEYLDSDNKYKPATTVAVDSLDTKDAKNIKAVIDSNLAANTVYRATIVVNKNADQLEYVENTNPTISDPFFYISTADLITIPENSKTDNSITYKFKTGANEGHIVINDVEATYKAEVNKVLKDDNNKEYTLGANKEIKNAIVTTDDNGYKYLTIQDLDDNQSYVIKIIATVGTVTGESDLIGYTAGVAGAEGTYTSAPKTYKTAPAINGLKVVKGDASEVEAKAVRGTFFVNTDDGTIIINGNDIENPITIGTSNNNYTPKFNDILSFADDLVDGDKITVTDSKISLVLTEDKSASTAITIPATKLEDMEVEVVGNGIPSDRKMTVTGGAKLEKLTVGGNGLILALTNSDSANTTVYLSNDAEVTGNNDYTLVKGATAKINGVKVNTTKADVVITATGDKALEVNTPAGNVTTDLTFTNVNDGRYDVTDPVTIDFKGTDTTSEIVGTVKINSENGEIVVTANDGDKLDLTKLNLDINVKDANVDITGFTDSSKVNVTVATTEKDDPADDTTLKATLNKEKMELLGKITDGTLTDGDSIVLMKYADDEDMTVNATPTKLTGNDRKAMQDFIDSFEINNENVEMTFDDVDAGEVTITIKGDTTINISGFATYGNK